MPRWLRFAVVLAIGALVVVLVLAFRRDPHDLRTGTVGKPAAEVSAPLLDGGGTMTIAPTGRVIVVNFFASWCIPCKQENPSLVRVYERYRAASDVEFVGVLYQDTRDNGLKYVRDNGVTWSTIDDNDGRVAFAYGVFGIPETFFIGTDGVIAGRHIGPIDETTLVNAIDSLRAKARP